MLVWAPYENISSQAYPATLISIGGRDPIVPFWEGLKWGIKVRAHQTGTAPIVIKLNPAADHSASVGEDAALKERALQYAFISKYLEVSAPSPLPHG